MDLGEKVKLRREQLGWSQEDLATKMGYASRSSINKIEKGRPISQKIIYRLSEILGVSIAYLMGWDEDIIDAIAQDQQEQTEQFMKINAILEQLLELDLTEDEAEKIVEYGKFIRSQRK